MRSTLRWCVNPEMVRQPNASIEGAVVSGALVRMVRWCAQRLRWCVKPGASTLSGNAFDGASTECQRRRRGRTRGALVRMVRWCAQPFDAASTPEMVRQPNASIEGAVVSGALVRMVRWSR